MTEKGPKSSRQYVDISLEIRSSIFRIKEHTYKTAMLGSEATFTLASGGERGLSLKHGTLAAYVLA